MRAPARVNSHADAACAVAVAALERALSQVETDAQAEEIIRSLQRLAGARTIEEETGSADLPTPGGQAEARSVADAITRASQAAPQGNRPWPSLPPPRAASPRCPRRKPTRSTRASCAS